MRIVQTFWTAGQDPLKHSFGWLHPEYNLMSWALSCLSLREHYDEVVLYTDSRGKEVLIDLLHLPYTEVNVVYDDFKCLPQHWALAKIKTYSLQTKPFLHIDGDVYLPKPIDPSILDAPLIAQNREIGTEYYRKMADDFLAYKGLIVPKYIKECIVNGSVTSYNMGIFGGCNIDYIQKYCSEVLSFADINEMNNPRCSNSCISCNIIMEQIWFAVCTCKNERIVNCILCDPVTDNGYTIHEFCDLDRYHEKQFMHLLGGHKRNMEVVDMLTRFFINNYPNMYWKILSIFPDKNIRLNESKVRYSTWLDAERCLINYENFLSLQFIKWENLNLNDIFEQEKKTSKSFQYLKLYRNIDSCILQCVPDISFYKISQNWHPLARQQIANRLRVKSRNILYAVAMRPSFSGKGIKEVALDEVKWKILDTLRDTEMTFSDLYQRMISNYDKETNDGMHDYISSTLKNLVENLICNGLIIIKSY